MCDIVPVETVGIAKDGGRFFRWDVVLGKVGNCLPNIPCGHFVCVHEVGAQAQDMMTKGEG